MGRPCTHSPPVQIITFEVQKDVYHMSKCYLYQNIENLRVGRMLSLVLTSNDPFLIFSLWCNDFEKQQKDKELQLS